MLHQIEIKLKPRTRGFHLVTSEIVSQLPQLPQTGIVNIFTKHTSCGLCINENYDPDVRGDMERIFKINTFSHINLIQQLITQKKLNKGASIVFTSSMSGVYCGLAGGSLYGATKSAILGYTKALAIELANRGIRVNTIHPGMIETPITAGTALSKELLEEDAKNYPLGRYGKPEEIAYSIVYLLSDATAWMTGTQLLIDGGYSVK